MFLYLHIYTYVFMYIYTLGQKKSYGFLVLSSFWTRESWTAGPCQIAWSPFRSVLRLWTHLITPFPTNTHTHTLVGVCPPPPFWQHTKREYPQTPDDSSYSLISSASYVLIDTENSNLVSFRSWLCWLSQQTTHFHQRVFCGACYTCLFCRTSGP